MKFIGMFSHMTNQEQVSEADRRHGEFSLIVEAETPDQAIRMFKDRICGYRKNSQFFEGVCRIFLVQLLEFDDFPKSGAVMLNYKSIAGDPIMPFISCTVPTDQRDWCSIYDWKDNWPEVDGQSENLFIEFKEESARKKIGDGLLKHAFKAFLSFMLWVLMDPACSMLMGTGGITSLSQPEILKWNMPKKHCLSEKAPINISKSLCF